MSARLRWGWTTVGFAVVSVALIGVFAIDIESSTHEQVDFDNTVSVGLSLEEQYELEDDVALPRAQVFYSQYDYVVGYYGVERFVEHRRQPGHDQRFGYPLTVLVSDYSSVDVALTSDGHPATDADPGWIDAEDAHYVVGSQATTPSGGTVVPFSERADADTFADDHGGTVLDWEEVLSERFDIDDAALVGERVSDDHRDADERTEEADTLLDRPVSIVVGENADTVQEAIDDAPAETTVVVPNGTYAERLEVDRPITLAGATDATIDGGGDGTVVNVTASDVAITGLEITGVGNETTGTDDAVAHDHGAPDDEDEGDEDWDEEFVDHYAGGNAAIATSGADGALIENVEVQTPANGIVLYRSDGAVVRNVSVEGHEIWQRGAAGVFALYDPVVIENSTLTDGRDAVYTHRANGAVIRNNELSDNRLGVHVMHTSDLLIADNQMDGQDNAGVYVMTGPERIALIGNEVRNASVGLTPGGTDSYVAENVLEANDVGLRTDATSSIYERNVIAGNGNGIESRELLPTNRVTENDFVGNRDHAMAIGGPIRIWTHDGVGNYWQGAVGLSDGETIDRPHSPTDPVEERLHMTDGTATLAQAPGLDVRSGLEGVAPGMRSGHVVDFEPSCEPRNPELLERTDWSEQAWACDERYPT